MRSPVILFMTACINPNGMPQTTLQDINIRKEQYLQALNFYLQETNFPILFVENTGVNIKEIYKNEIYNNRLEILVFDGNHFNKSLGKGYGEGIIIKYAFKHSKMLKESKYRGGVIKVSGRYVVLNINTIVNISSILVSNLTNYVICNINKNAQSATSDLFIASKNFYTDYLIPNLHTINESKRIWFEHVLFKSIREFYLTKNKFIFLPIPLNQDGISGSTGKQIEKPTIKDKVVHLIKTIFYKIDLFKIK